MTNKYGKNLTTKFINRVLLQTGLFTISLFVAYLFFRFLCEQILWQKTDPLYQLLHNFDTNIAWIVVVWLFGFLIILVINFMKPLRYIDDLVAASEILLVSDEEWITLPSDLLAVQERMNQLKQQALRSSRLAHENEQKKDDLIVYLAHDIKTPLTSMIGYLSLLDEIDDMPPKKREKYIKIALDKSYKLEELVNELFDITRFNSEKIILEEKEIHLTTMLEQIVDDFYPLLKEKNQQIKLDFEEGIVVQGDPNQLARVFNNVLKNAVTYSYENTNIEIAMKKSNSVVLITIVNHGKTIPPEKLQKIFEKFYRVDPARTSKTGGSGLGLAIAKEIILLHHGSIEATSSDQVTKFQIQLPLS